MTADPCWWSSDVVKPAMKPACVEPSEWSESTAASRYGHCTKVNQRYRMDQESHILGLLQLVHSIVLDSSGYILLFHLNPSSPQLILGHPPPEKMSMTFFW